MTSDRSAVVWAATWVPTAAPLEGFGSDGYWVCWVDLPEGERVQVLAAGVAPAPGMPGAVVTRTLGDVAVEVFEARS